MFGVAWPIFRIKRLHWLWPGNIHTLCELQSHEALRNDVGCLIQKLHKKLLACEHRDVFVGTILCILPRISVRKRFCSIMYCSYFMLNLSIPVPFIGLRQACDSHVGARGLWLCAQHLHSNCARRRITVSAQHKTVVFLNVESLLFQTSQHSSPLVYVVTEHRIDVWQNDDTETGPPARPQWRNRHLNILLSFAVSQSLWITWLRRSIVAPTTKPTTLDESHGF